MDKILLGHGSGGKLSHELISNLFMPHFSNDTLLVQGDAALLPGICEQLAFTTDSFVVDPVFFPGGDIGKLAVAGTVNDLAVSGAEPLYLSASFIIEEGMPFADLERIVVSMAKEARNAGILIVTGDTKVVNRGKCDKLFINTSGIGRVKPQHAGIVNGREIRPGDKILVNGTLGDHGIAVLAARKSLHFETKVHSDCACLNQLISGLLGSFSEIHFMRDATRGGLATVLCETTLQKPYGIRLNEAALPVREEVAGACEIFGYDPLYVANEGKVVIIASAAEAPQILKKMKENPLGMDSAIIGEVVDEHPGKVVLETTIGGNRIVDMLAGEQLPRIC